MTIAMVFIQFVLTLCLVYLEGQGLPRAAALIIWIIGLILLLAVMYQEKKAKDEKKRLEQLKEFKRWERKMDYQQRDVKR